MTAELITSRLRLRQWEESDAPALFAAFGDTETMRFWDRPALPDLNAMREMIRSSRDVDPQWHAAFAIVAGETGEPIGMVNYHDRRAPNRRLAVGWIVARAWQRRGIMREAVPALLDHCFTTLDTHRIEARIEGDNIPSVALASWLGFQREGLMRDWMFVADQPRSVWMHALLRPEWQARRDQVSSTSNP